MNNRIDNTGKFEKFLNYLRESVHLNESAYKNSATLRIFIKWIFDLVRNLMIVGVILFLAEKTGNQFLKYISVAGTVLLLLYVYSYLDTHMIQPFHPIKNKKIAMTLNGLLHIAVFVALWVSAQLMILKVIDSVAKAYLD